MLTRKLAFLVVLAIFTPIVIGPGCGGSSNTSGTGGKGGKGGATAGTGAAGTGAAGTGTAGTGTAGTGAAGTSTAGTMGVDAAAGADAAAGTGASDANDASAEPLPPVKPDGAQGVSYLFDTTVQGWKYSIYGSTPNGMPNSPMNLATLSGGAPAFDATNDSDNKTTSGSLKGTIPFKAVGDRIDFQAFSVGAGMYDWTGYKVAGKVKLVSGGNLTPGCPLKAYFYLSGPMPNYTTVTATPADLVTGTWVTLTFDTDVAAGGGVDLTKISQLGIQIDTGAACVGTTPDGGASDAADGGASDAAAADAATDLMVDSGLMDASDAASDASDAVVVPVTASTAVILVDSVIVSVK